MREELSNNHWLFIDSGQCDASTNMAIDVYLAQNIDDDKPVLRFYQWRPYTISLGYGQKVDQIETEKCKQDNIQIVRRPTGGRAVLHAEEITYAVVIPKASQWYHDSILMTYNFISRGLVAGLKSLNINASLEKRTLKSAQYAENALRAIPCFSAAAQYEILYQGKKLVGSAQRRFDKAILQHGSILVGSFHLKLVDYLTSGNPVIRERLRKYLDQKTIAISQILGRPISYEQGVDALKKGFIREYAMTFVNKKVTSHDVSEINQLKKQFPNLWR